MKAIASTSPDPPRCAWVPKDNTIYRRYHDEEWGIPSHDPLYLFEMICLEGSQAGLSWWTILSKREAYRAAFHRFDPAQVAEMTDAELESQRSNSAIVRHRGKIESIRSNARAWLALADPVDWLWSHTGHQVIRNSPRVPADLRARSPQADKLAKSLKAAGFGFMGPTTAHAFMQAVGMIDDHLEHCGWKREIEKLASPPA